MMPIIDTAVIIKSSVTSRGGADGGGVGGTIGGNGGGGPEGPGLGGGSGGGGVALMVVVMALGVPRSPHNLFPASTGILSTDAAIIAVAISDPSYI